MRAVRVRAFGSAPGIEDVPDPAPAAGRTVVQVEAATVGHVDRSIWSGGFLRHPPLPYVPGVEAAGRVVQSDSFEEGRRVWVRGGGLGTVTDGTWAELVSAPDASLGFLPDDVAFEIGACFFSPCASAWVSLHSVGRLAHGETVLVTGAAGAVGTAVCALAVEAGGRVVGAVSRPERVALLAAGVEPVVVDPTSPDVPADLAADLLVDTVGGATLAAVLPCVTPGGRAVVVGYTSGTRVELDLAAFAQRDVSLLPLNMIRREGEGRAAAPDLLRRLADGRLHVVVETFPLGAAADALAWLGDPGHRGRAVLLPAAGERAP